MDAAGIRNATYRGSTAGGLKLSLRYATGPPVIESGRNGLVFTWKQQRG